MGNVRTVPLAASVPLFAATKAEKAFGFRVNRVYITDKQQVILKAVSGLDLKNEKPNFIPVLKN